MTEPVAPLTVPCEADDHWRQIWIGFLFRAGTIDEAAIREEIGLAPDLRTFSLSDPGCSGSGRIARRDGATILSLSTVRLPRASAGTAEGPGPVFSHGQVLSHLAALSRAGSLPAYATVELGFSRDETAWRIPLLASPPNLTETQSALGRVELTGLTLRFSDSPVGLSEVTFGSEAADNLSIELGFGLAIDGESMGAAYEIILSQAEEWADLFIESRAPAERAEREAHGGSA